jgi:hypothetical protein
MNSTFLFAVIKRVIMVRLFDMLMALPGFIVAMKEMSG